MSDSSSTRTFAVRRPPTAKSLASLKAAEAFLENVSPLEIPGSLCEVNGDTGNGWAIYTTRNLLGGRYPSLGFLTDSGHRYTFKKKYGLTAIEVLAAEQVAQAAADLGRLLRELAREPMAAYDAEEFGLYMEGEVEAALRRRYVCANPRFDGKVGGEDGQGADYLFVYLRSVLAVLKTAQEAGAAVVHVLRI